MQLQKEILFNMTFWRQDVPSPKTYPTLRFPQLKIVASSCPTSSRSRQAVLLRTWTFPYIKHKVGLMALPSLINTIRRPLLELYKQFLLCHIYFCITDYIGNNESNLTSFKRDLHHFKVLLCFW